MKLLEHNIKAYNRVKRMFDDGHTRVCVVHPTGTGKSYIVAKLIYDNPDKYFIVLTPSNYIISSLQATLPARHNSQYLTYQYIIRQDELFFENLKCDFLILDEFHFLGAEIWGAGVEKIISNNKSLKIFGTSATPVRFNDNHRNMVDELFNGNVASNLTLNECFINGILPSPIYISSIYSIAYEEKRLAQKILLSSHKNKETLALKLKSNVIDWTKSNGVNAMVKKHLDKSYRKIIAFAPSVSKINFVVKMIAPVLEEIYGVDGFEIFRIDSGQNISDNQRLFNRFKEKNEKALIAVTVDMLNTGIHISGVECTMLFRSTSSPIVFYQQIGRCLDAGNKEKTPVIFDFVNNFRAINFKSFKKDYENTYIDAEKKNFTHLGRGNLKHTFGVKFIDETKPITDLFSILSNEISDWNVNYLEAKEFFNLNGNLTGIKSSNSRISSWLSSQRRLYKNNALSKEKIIFLEQLNIDWNPDAAGSVWEDRFLELKEFIERFKREPYSRSGESVGAWLSQQRYRLKKNRLPEHQKNLLLSLVPPEGPQEQVNDKKNIILQDYYDEKGNLDIKSSDKKHWNTVKSLRRKYNEGRMKDEEIEWLKKRGFIFSKIKTWEEKYELYKKYVGRTGYKSVSQKDDKELYLWVTVQRREYKKGELMDYREKLLNEIGFDFTPAIGINISRKNKSA